MTHRLSLALVLSSAFVIVPIWTDAASAQQTPPPAAPAGSVADYAVPIAIGVVLGALAWPLVAPTAVAITADNVAAAATGNVARAAAPAAARTAAWTWQSLVSSRVVGGVIGGLVGYATTP